MMYFLHILSKSFCSSLFNEEKELFSHFTMGYIFSCISSLPVGVRFMCFERPFPSEKYIYPSFSSLCIEELIVCFGKKEIFCMSLCRQPSPSSKTEYNMSKELSERPAFKAVS